MRKYLVAILLLFCCCFFTAACSSCNNTVAVSGITCTQNYDLEVGDNITIEYTLSPADCTNKNVTFSSSDESIITVSGTGNVVAVSCGNATVTIKCEDGGFSATCSFTINEKSYTASFVADGEIISTSKFTQSNSDISVPEVPEKEGYTGEWEDYSLSNADIIIKAIYTPIEYEAQFLDENGNYLYSIPYTVEGLLSEEPEVPHKDYYTGEWESYSLKAGGITVDAIYTPIEYTAKFIVDGEVVDEQPYTIENMEVTPPQINEKTGYTAEWEPYEVKVGGIEVNAIYTPIVYTATYTANKAIVDKITFTVETMAFEEPSVPEENGYTAEWEDYTLSASDITINAVYTLITYTITYEDTKDAENTNAETYNIESKFNLENLSAEGYNFEGWYLNDNKQEVITNMYGNITLVAQWSLKEYKVYFADENGNEIYSTQTYTIENYTIEEPCVPKKDGYEGSWSHYILNFEDETYVLAEYKPIEYNITYENTKGVENANAESYTIESQFELVDLSAEGYVFEGWFLDGDKLTSLNGLNSDITLSAEWSPVKYYVYFTDETHTYVYFTEYYTIDNTNITEPDVPEKEGYKGSWSSYSLNFDDITYVVALYSKINDGPSESGSDSPSEFGDDNQTQFTATFIADDVVVATLQFTSESKAIDEPYVPEREGYTGKWEDYTLSDDDITVYAVYIINEYSISFNVDGEVYYKTTFNVENKSIAEPTIPDKEGYTAKWENYTLLLDNLTVNAIYTAIEYNIYFYEGGSLLATRTFTVETQSVDEPQITAKEGYEAYWETYEFTIGDKSVNAVYTLAVYTVTFKADDEIVDVQKYTIEDKNITEPKVTEKLGYNGAWESYELTTGDVIVNAVYTIIEYTVTFIADNVEVYKDTYTASNRTVNEPPVPAKAGYTGEWQVFNLDECKDLTVYAEYTPIEYKIYFYVGDELKATRTFTLETTTIDEPSVPEKEGYNGEWESYSLVADNIKVSAVYTPIEYKVTFVADGNIIGTTTYTVENTKIDEPEVPEKEGYSGSWKSYSLTMGDVTVNAIYTELAVEDEDSYIITYVADGETIAEIAYKDGIPTEAIPEVPQKDGYYSEWEVADLSSERIINALYTSVNATEGLIYETNSDGTLTVTGFSGSDTIVNIPAVYKNAEVTAISDTAFKSNTTITELVVPKTITAFTMGIFSGMSSLTAITIPFVGSSVDVSYGTDVTCFGYIFGTESYTGGYAVTQYYTPSYPQKFYIPESLVSVTVLGGNIYYGAFSNCNKLTDITIYDAETIQNEVFKGCSALKNITLPFVGSKKSPAKASYSTLFGYVFSTEEFDSSVEIEQYYSDSNSSCCTYYIPKLLKTVTILGGKIMYGAFYGCQRITTINIGDEVESIGVKAFYNCSTSLKYIYFTNDSTWELSLSGATIEKDITKGENYLDLLTTNYGYEWKRIEE